MNEEIVTVKFFYLLVYMYINTYVGRKTAQGTELLSISWVTAHI